MDFAIAQTEDAVTVVRPSGRLNMLAAPNLRRLVSETIEDGARRIVVDLADTEFIDSSGLGALVAGLKAARSAGGDLRIARATRQVQTALELTNLNRVLKPHPSVEAAYGDH